MTSLKRTPLYVQHKSLKARMVPFGGWEMPVQYEGVLQEHSCVRDAVGLFDVSHMGEFYISGDRAREFLNRVTTNDVDKLYDGRCQYTLLCYPNGTVVDDLIISQISQDKYLAVVNASNIDKDFSWLKENNQEGIELQNVSDQNSLLAVQGPLSSNVINELFGQDFSGLKYYHFQIFEEQGHQIFLSRTGYTGEDGFEIMIPNSQVETYWNKILEIGQKHKIKPIGLAARDTLRLEAAYSLYGHEINDQINAYWANLGWVIKLSKGDFIGKTTLEKTKSKGPAKKIIGFEMLDPGIARDGYEIYRDDTLIGRVTSGTHSPTLKKSIGLALVDKDYTTVGDEILIDIRQKKKKAVIVKTPFYKRDKA